MRLRYGFACALAGTVATALFTAPSASADSSPSRPSRPSRSPRTSRSVSVSRDNVERLAALLDDERTVAELKREGALSSPQGSEMALLDAMRAYEALGDPEGAAELLKRRSARFPQERTPRVQLAMLYERMGKSESALPVWQALDDKFGLTVEQTVQYARALSRVGRSADALVLLKKNHPDAALRATGAKAKEATAAATQDYWRDLAKLAWQFDESAEALAAYRRVWAADHRAPDAALRLMTLAAEAGEREEAAAVAREAYKLEKEPRFLLFIAEQGERAEDWAGVARILNVPVSEQQRFEGREQFWLLRAEAYDHLGNKNAARDCYRAALRLNPASVPIRLSLLWDALDRSERGETDNLREYVEAWRDDVGGEPEMWSPYAQALVRLGRVREAIPFYQKRLSAAPDEYGTMLAYADALDKIQRADAAMRLRRHAFAKLREGFVAQVQAGARARGQDKAVPNEFHLLEHHADLSRRLAGVEEGERWFAYAMNHSKPSEYRDDFAIGWNLDNERSDYVKRQLTSRKGARVNRPIWDSYRLVLASSDDDRTEMRRLLASSSNLGYSERYRAELELGRDDLALATIQEQLARDEPIPDEPELRHTQREIFERHAVAGKVGGTYEYVDGLHLQGPDVLASHDFLGGRILYEGFGREMTSPNGSVNVPNDGRRLEGDLGVTLRFQKRDSIFEVGAGANYQPRQPVPHFELFNATDILRGRVSTVVNLHVNMPIPDTPFMRLVGVRNELQLMGHFGITEHLYAEAEVFGRENTSRTFEHLSGELGGTADVGVHVLRRTPELNIAVRGSVSHRANVSRIPNDLLDTIPIGTAKEIETYLAPSYRMVSFVVQLTRGDFFERQRVEWLPLPRYDCSAELGYLFPQNTPAGSARCSASIRITPHGYLSALGSYTLGLFGLEDATNVRTSLAYTQFFL
ncbi:tetratricopeptide repeat protein [Pendulispora albinea]|uniref:Tetratricopeptide repeat protein n=1 Tax=Pendulispora albinea TaxID=2741071 RepID=A0ABZ2LR61_9BACT